MKSIKVSFDVHKKLREISAREGKTIDIVLRDLLAKVEDQKAELGGGNSVQERITTSFNEVEKDELSGGNSVQKRISTTSTAVEKDKLAGGNSVQERTTTTSTTKVEKAEKAEDREEENEIREFTDMLWIVVSEALERLYCSDEEKSEEKFTGKVWSEKRWQELLDYLLLEDQNIVSVLQKIFFLVFESHFFLEDIDSFLKVLCERNLWLCPECRSMLVLHRNLDPHVECWKCGFWARVEEPEWREAEGVWIPGEGLKKQEAVE